jgi:hypothetical protein
MMVHHETPLPPLVPKMIPAAIVTRAPSSYEHDKRRRPDPRCAHIKHSKKSNRYRISLGVLNADVVMAHEQIFGRVDPADDYRLRDSTWIDA